MGAVKSKWLQQRLYNKEKHLYHSASRIITLSPGMTSYVANLGINPDKIITNYNGTDLELAAAVQPAPVMALRRKYNLACKRVALYAGTYGRANGIPALMQTIESMAADASITFVFAGSGFYSQQLQELALRVPNLLLLPPQPRHEVFKWFSLADVSLISFNDLPVLATNSPAKFYDSLACGTPVVVTNPGWTKSFVDKYKCGWYTPAGQPEAMAQTIKAALAQPQELQQAGERGAAIAIELFDRQQLVTQIEEILLNVVRK